MNKTKLISIKDLKFDERNVNNHTQQGLRLLEKSLQKLGAGRSILIDKNNNIIAGNGVVEVAGQIGLDKVLVVPTDGDTIVAVQRMDLDLNSPEGREMAIADNQTAKVGIDFDLDVLQSIKEDYGINLSDWELDLIELDLPDNLEYYAPEHTPKEKKQYTLAFHLAKADYDYVISILNSINNNHDKALIKLCNAYEQSSIGNK